MKSLKTLESLEDLEILEEGDVVEFIVRCDQIGYKSNSGYLRARYDGQRELSQEPYLLFTYRFDRNHIVSKIFAKKEFFYDDKEGLLAHSGRGHARKHYAIGYDDSIRVIYATQSMQLAGLGM